MSWHILGNGPTDGTISENDRYILFNQGYPQLIHACRVSNQRFEDAGKALAISGTPPFAGFEAALNLQHQKLQHVLYAVPSSGLCCLMALTAEGLFPTVRGMTLLPSLRRPPSLAARKPLACYFHNWLAERRLVIPFIDQLDWPQFRLEPFTDDTRNRVNPYALLASLPNVSRAEGLTLIEVVAFASADSWLQPQPSAEMAALDTLFYLPRSKANSPNWWLFDDDACALIALVHHQLAWAQQVLLEQVSPAAWR